MVETDTSENADMIAEQMADMIAEQMAKEDGEKETENGERYTRWMDVVCKARRNTKNSGPKKKRRPRVKWVRAIRRRC